MHRTLFSPVSSFFLKGQPFTKYFVFQPAPSFKFVTFLNYFFLSVSFHLMNFSRTMFSSGSNDISNISGICCITKTNASTPSTTTSHLPPPFSSDNNITALRQLSDNLALIFDSNSDSDLFTDAKIVLPDGQQVSVHRCIISARSGFFKNLFKGSGGKLQLKELAKDYDVGLDALKAVLGYLYSGRVKPMPKGVCVCVDDDCSHVGCRLMEPRPKILNESREPCMCHAKTQ